MPPSEYPLGDAGNIKQILSCFPGLGPGLITLYRTDCAACARWLVDCCRFPESQQSAHDSCRTTRSETTIILPLPPATVHIVKYLTNTRRHVWRVEDTQKKKRRRLRTSFGFVLTSHNTHLNNAAIVASVALCPRDCNGSTTTRVLPVRCCAKHSIACL